MEDIGSPWPGLFTKIEKKQVTNYTNYANKIGVAG